MSTGAGGYDWLDVWRRMYDQERAQAEDATDPAFARFADHWASQAGRFAKSVARSPQPDGFMRFVLPRLRSGDTLIDVGAGTGRYLPTLAPHVERIVAVEPSPAMRGPMEQLVTDGELHNVEIVPEQWPNASTPSADVVISAHVLYGVREVGPFLQALDEAAQRACYLFLALRHPTSFMSIFWQELRGEPRLPLPCALEALNALHQLGIPAHMHLVPVAGVYSFADVDEALEDIRYRLRFAPDADRDLRIRQAIDRLLQPAPDGSLAVPGQMQHAAVLYWERNEVRG